MAISVYKTWNTNDVLTSADLNASFTQIVNNGLALISPLTGNLDFNGNSMIIDADADSTLVELSDDVIGMKIGSTTAFKWDQSVASLVNGWTWTGSATGVSVKMQAQGTDTNISAVLAGKGTGSVNLANAALTSNLFSFLTGTASTVNGFQFQSATTGNPPRITSLGSDSNIGLVLEPKGTGTLIAQAASGTQLFAWDTGVASAVNGCTWTSSATGNPVKLDAYGSDSNISLSLAAKGTGMIILRKSSTSLFIFDVGATTPVNGLTFAAPQTGSDVTVTAQGSDAAISINLLSKSTGVVKINSLPIPFLKTYAANTNNDQALTGGSETDITGLTALSLPDTTSVNTKTFRVSGSATVAETSGAGTSLVTLRIYNGANGTKADTEVHRRGVILASSGTDTLAWGPFEWTPGNSAHTKFGVSITMTRNGTVYGNNTASQLPATILVERVA